MVIVSKAAFKVQYILVQGIGVKSLVDWTLISHCIDCEEDAVELLREVVALWVTIRGFSIAALSMKTYKTDYMYMNRSPFRLRKELSPSTE